MHMVMGVALAALAFSGPAAAQDDEPLPKAKPIGSPGAWIPANGYPPAAAASGEQGRVAFTLTVDETGRVSECKVTKSSESPLLDETTCNFMTANGRFEIPRDKKNRPTTGTWSSAMTWKLESLPPPPEPTAAMGPAVTTPSSKPGSDGPGSGGTKKP